MTAYRTTRTVTVEDKEELHSWWQCAEHDEDYYSESQALELLLADPDLTAGELSTMGLLSFGPVSVEREDGDG